LSHWCWTGTSLACSHRCSARGLDHGGGEGESHREVLEGQSGGGPEEIAAGKKEKKMRVLFRRGI